MDVITDDWRLLALRAQAGDRAAYHRLLRSLTPGLRAFVSRNLHRDHSGDVEDIVQEALLAIHIHLKRYNSKRPFAPWAYAIARYKLLDYLRRHKRKGISVPLEVVDDFLAAPEPPGREEEQVMIRLLEHLPAKQRLAIELVKLKSMSVKEAAAASDMSESGIKVSIHRGIKKLAVLWARRS